MHDKLQQSKIHTSRPRTRFAQFLGGKWPAAVLIGIGAIVPTVLATQPHAQKAAIKIALIADKTGILEAYAKQTSAGFAMGLDYATGGTMTVAGRKLVVIEKDSQTKPDVGRTLSTRPTTTTAPTSRSAAPVRPWRWPCCRLPSRIKKS